RRPALRLLRKLPKFREALDIIYRRYGRAITLQDMGATTRLSDEVIKPLEAMSQFRIYSKLHFLFRPGESIDRLSGVNPGWLRLSEGAQHQYLNVGAEEGRDWDKTAGERYFGPSHCFGIEAVTRDSKWPQTGVLLGRTEVLEISISKLRQN